LGFLGKVIDFFSWSGIFFVSVQGDSSAYGVYKISSMHMGREKAKGIGRKEKIQGFLFGDFISCFLLLRYPVLFRLLRARSLKYVGEGVKGCRKDCDVRTSFL